MPEEVTRRQPVVPAVVLTPPARPVGMTLTPAAVNTRTGIEVYPRRPGEPPPRPSARPAQRVIAFFRHYAKPWEDRFVVATVGPPPRAAVPRGRMNPWGERANIAVPPAVAYGSLFTVQSNPYY
jgi:hypothetical protein